MTILSSRMMREEALRIVPAGLKRLRVRGARGRRWRGSVLLMSMVYMLLFAALASSMVAFSTGNMQVERAETDANRAIAAAESGMSFLQLQFKRISQPVIKEGSISRMAQPSLLWSGTNIEGLSGNNGVAVALATAFNGSGTFATSPVTAPSGTNPLNVPAISVDAANNDPSTFSLTVTWDSANPQTPAGSNTSIVVLHCTSTGSSHSVSRSVSMDIWVQKTLKYAVYSNVAIQLGKNVRVVGDVASTYNGTSKGPPIQMFSDFHYLPNLPAMDNDLATLRGMLNQYDTNYSNRLDVRNPSSQAAVAAKQAGFYDLSGDGYIDDYDVAIKNLDRSYSKTNTSSNAISSSDFLNPNTGQPYDPDLFAVIDAPMGPVSGGTLPDGSSPPWTGYGDGVINNLDGYAKVNGNLKMALSYSQWQSAASGWQQWGDTTGGTAGTAFRDQFEGPVIPTDNSAPVQFGVDFGSDQTLSPQDFDTSAYDAQVPAATATKVTSGSSATISNGTLTAAMANGGTIAEHSPSDATSGWQATLSRPVFQNVTFNNVRIPKGLNAKFINCTFNGYTSVKMNTNITTGGTVNSNGTISGGTTTTDPSNGMTWAQKMISGTFNANTTLTSSNSVAYTQGNNLHFSGCTFNGVVTSDVPTAYTHFADSWEFDGVTAFNNQVDPSVTIMAPNTNIEMGSYQNPGGNPSTLVGVVVAGNIDIRGSANVDGSLLVTGMGASNTTLGYFGSTDQGQAVPPQSQLPTQASGRYGHLRFQVNPGRGMPDGIAIPVVATPQYTTYQIK